MDLLSYYGWFAFSCATVVWLVIVGARLGGHKWRPKLAIASTVLLVLFGGALMANERWGSVPKHRATCESLRQRYEQATNIVDLERARDRLREARCSIARP